MKKINSSSLIAYVEENDIIRLSIGSILRKQFENVFIYSSTKDLLNEIKNKKDFELIVVDMSSKLIEILDYNKINVPTLITHSYIYTSKKSQMYQKEMVNIYTIDDLLELINENIETNHIVAC